MRAALASTCALALSLSCTGAQLRLVDQAIVVGCDLVAVALLGGEHAGTLCSDLAPAVEALLAEVAGPSASVDDDCRRRRRVRRVRELNGLGARPEGETIVEGYEWAVLRAAKETQ